MLDDIDKEYDDKYDRVRKEVKKYLKNTYGKDNLYEEISFDNYGEEEDCEVIQKIISDIKEIDGESVKKLVKAKDLLSYVLDDRFYNIVLSPIEEALYENYDCYYHSNAIECIYNVVRFSGNVDSYIIDFDGGYIYLIQYNDDDGTFNIIKDTNAPVKL